MTEKTTRGGKRLGSGRKRQGIRSVTFTASQNSIDILAGVKRKSEFINNAITSYTHKTMKKDGY